MAFDKNEWRPNRKQEEFLAIPTTIKEGFYGGGNGSGKSDVLLVYGLIHGWTANPRFKQVFMRRTFPELRNEIIPRSRDIYTKFGATLNRSEMCWTFPRPDQYGGTGMTNMGAMIFLGHCENEDDVHKYDSQEINLYTPDELTSFTEWIYLYIGMTRVRTSDTTLPAIIRAAGMPGGIGHTFTKKRFVDPYPKGGRIIIGKGGVKRIYIHSTLDDNKDHIDPAYAQSLEALPEAEKKARRFGDWSAYLGQVFDEFRDRRYPDEPVHAVHCVEPFTIPDWWPKFVVGDWGFRAYTYVAFFAISPNRKLYLYREMYWKQTKIAEWAPYIKQLIDLEKPRIIKFCKSAGQDRGQEQTIQEQISSELDFPVELTNNSPGSRIAGKILIHEYLRWTNKHVPIKEIPVYNEEHAAWILRNKGMAEYKNYLKAFDPAEEETNLPKLQIFRCDKDNHDGHDNCCPLMVDAIKACIYDKPKDNKPAEDVAEFDGDDPYDVLRYACDTASNYFGDASEELVQAKQRERFSQMLTHTQDYTAFYRNMSKLESEDRVQPIKRYHHATKH